jgi:hypothetical protein
LRLLTAYNYHGYRSEEFPEGAAGFVTMPVMPAEYLGADVVRLPIERRVIAAMQAAQKFFTRDELPAIIGGEVQLTVIEPVGISCRSIFKFPDFEHMRHAGAAIANRIIRGGDVPDVRDGLTEARNLTGGGSSEGAPISRQERRAAEKRTEKLARRAARAQKAQRVA